MEWFLEHWYLIVSGLALLIMLGAVVFQWFKLPTKTQVSNIKEWLCWAVTEAEKSLGSGTGQLKLRMVYSMATAQFPWLAKYVPFETFSGWVDEALAWMKTQLTFNENVANYVDTTQ